MTFVCTDSATTCRLSIGRLTLPSPVAAQGTNHALQAAAVSCDVKVTVAQEQSNVNVPTQTDII